MRISQQIGWSQESKLIYNIIQQLNRLEGVWESNCTPTTTTTTSSTSTTTTTTTTEFPVPICSQLLASTLGTQFELFVYDLCVDYNKNVTSAAYSATTDPYHITSSLNKFWTASIDGGTLTEFDIVISPFSGLTFNSSYSAPSGETIKGICALGDSVDGILACNFSETSLVEFSYTLGTYMTMVPYTSRNFVSSPIYVPLTNRIISLTTDSTNTYLSQYKYDGSGTLTVDIDITAYVPANEIRDCSIFSTNCDDVCAVYIYNHIDGKIWKVDITTHVITDSGKTMFSPDVRALSQFPNCTCELVPLA